MLSARSAGLAEKHHRTQYLRADLLFPRHPLAQSRELALSFRAIALAVAVATVRIAQRRHRYSTRRHAAP